MDYTNIIIAGCTVIATVVSVTKILGKKFDKIDLELKEIKTDIGEIKVKVGKLETAIETNDKWETRLYDVKKAKNEEKP